MDGGKEENMERLNYIIKGNFHVHGAVKSVSVSDNILHIFHPK